MFFFGGGKINQPGQLAPGDKDNESGGKIPRDIFTSGGQAVQGGGGGGGTINCYTGTQTAT